MKLKLSKTITLKRAALSAMTCAAVASLWACGGGDNQNASNTPTPAAPFNASTPAATSQQFQVVTFGDSLLDVGTYLPGVQAALQKTGMDATQATGRYTTNPGLNWSQDVAAYYGNGSLNAALTGGFGFPTTPNATGYGYAQGGARVQAEPGVGVTTDPTTSPLAYPVATQLTNYQTDHGTQFSSGQLVLVDGGANDIFTQLGMLAAPTGAESSDTAAANVKAAADALATVVAQIVAAGATHVVVANVPDIGQTPFGVVEQPKVAQAASSLVSVFNGELASQLAAQNLMSKIVYVDLAGALDYVVKYPQQYGFTHTNDAMACDASKLGAFGDSSLFCTPQAYVATDADKTYMFADDVHPTTALQQLLATIVENAVNTSLASK